ncbi:MAG: 4Fe-4S binding protein [Candidatus Omnitrophota bacterium]
MLREDKKTIILFFVFFLFGSSLSLAAAHADAIYRLRFLWSNNFQLLVKIAIILAFCFLIFQLLTRKMSIRWILKLIYGMIFIPILLLPVFRCYFKVPYVFCRVCPDRCPWGMSRAFVFSSFLILNLSGRFWCTSLCPFGAFQNCQTQISKQNFKLPLRDYFSVYMVLLLTAWMYSLTLSGSQALAYFESVGYKWMGVTVFIAALILIAAFFIPRFWCRYFCPVGAIAELISGLKRRFMKSEISK